MAPSPRRPIGLWRLCAGRRARLCASALLSCALLLLASSLQRLAGSSGGSGEAVDSGGTAQASRRQLGRPGPAAGAAAAARLARPSELGAAVAAPAGVHGYVHKQGPLDPRRWHTSHQAWREEQRRGWQADRQDALAAGG